MEKREGENAKNVDDYEAQTGRMAPRVGGYTEQDEAEACGSIDRKPASHRVVQLLANRNFAYPTCPDRQQSSVNSSTRMQLKCLCIPSSRMPASFLLRLDLYCAV